MAPASPPAWNVAVDYLAGLILTQRLRPALVAGAPARVVNIVSASMNDTLAGTGVVDAMAPPPMRWLVKWLLPTPEQAAATILRVATDPGLDGVTGRYFDQGAEATTAPLSHDRALQQRIIDLCGS